MRKPTTTVKTFLAPVVLVLVIGMGVSQASSVVLKISTVNPIEKVQKKEVRSNLPPGIGTNDILNLDGMELRYDIKKDIYYVYRLVELEPKGRRDFRVEMRDIWVIPEEDMAALKTQAKVLSEKLKGSAFEQVGSETEAAIAKELDRILEVQKKATIASGAKAVDHIRVFHANAAALGDIRNRVGQLENLVLGTGQDPGQLMGSVRGASTSSRDIVLAPEAYREAVIKIVVTNPSPTQKRKVNIRRDLPKEVSESDVLDPGGLQAGTDIKRGITYVFAEKMDLDPGQTRTFNVKIRDKWNVNGPRIIHLKQTASNVLERVGSLGKFTSVETLLAGVVEDISRIEKEKGPNTLNNQYVAFFRGQGERLDLIEQRIHRVEAALQPMKKTSKLGFKAKPPSARTTWLIIYIILGFLALVSLLFFLRWFGKGKSENVDFTGGGEEG